MNEIRFLKDKDCGTRMLARILARKLFKEIKTPSRFPWCVNGGIIKMLPEKADVLENGDT